MRPFLFLRRATFGFWEIEIAAMRALEFAFAGDDSILSVAFRLLH
jgi:hypothetical protein